MHTSLENLNLVKNKVNELIDKKQLKTNPKIIVVSKAFPLDKILPLLNDGHEHFGENKIQEAENKWRDIRKNNNIIKLHMIGNLQTNKAKKAVQLFDYIHSLDNKKLAIKIAEYQKILNKKIKLFIQVNFANEKQKSGISLKELNDFYHFCNKELSLNIIGLMCFPPFNIDPVKYFIAARKLALDLNLKELSMGMSTDYEHAVTNGSTFLRLGAAILGKRIIT